jgi:ATP-dependent DNA helicase RecG
VQLKDKASGGGHGRAVMPDVLVMTATPIPRSLSLTLYGDLDVTVLDELPPGRKPITTQLITPVEEARRHKLYAFVREQAAAGFGTYIVCPFVEESDTLPGTSAVIEHQRLATEVFPELTVELVHGQMRPDAKDTAMARFRSGEAQILVATTVIEVGVDVPHATVMVIEDAERFGISQLHQLRGRVGRGGDRSYCVLFAGWNLDLSDDALERLEAVAGTTDGFELAETDLDIRGAGQLFGKRQSGLPDLKVADLRRDLALIGTTRDLARDVIDADPDLTDPANAPLRDRVLRTYEGGLEAFEALETG